MQEYIFTSKVFTGHLKFGYREGILVHFENNGELNAIQIKYLSENFPVYIDQLERIKGESGKIEDVTDLSFEKFWEDYGYKVDKKQAEEFWKKMSKADRLHAISAIPRYKTQCRMKNRDLIYPIRYLRNRRYEDGK
jgi:hypothetical protein